MTVLAGAWRARRVALWVSAAWLFVAVVIGAQASLGSAVRNTDPLPLSRAITAALIQCVPWIPVTLIVIALTMRFPISRRSPRNVLVHLAAAPVLAFAANVLVVLGYWITMGRFDGLDALIRQGALWATLRFHVALLIYGAILAITEGAQYYRAMRERELRLAKVEGQLARARLQALNAQIRPHFLFNALHTIGQLWRSGRSDDADALLDHLGSLFHRVQTSTAQLQIPLADELEMVKDYLAIEEGRFRDRLRAEVHATPEALDCLVPPLLLQPLVENAVRHGISVVSTAGIVEVSAAVQDGRLLVTVRDDGPGLGAASHSSGTGTGLRNTRERLEQLAGNGSAPAALRLESEPGRGTIVSVELPAIRLGETTGVANV
ncbi:MAG TPA: histidine kinase [Gemmatimonadaceae bacterium]|nr:histidine kinase [Gemmatimonadaceae bacterium]